MTELQAQSQAQRQAHNEAHTPNEGRNEAPGQAQAQATQSLAKSLEQNLLQIAQTNAVIHEMQAFVDGREALFERAGMDMAALRAARETKRTPAMQAEIDELVRLDIEAAQLAVREARARAGMEGVHVTRKRTVRPRMMI